MWPKAISSLIELAPHITRLVPLADRFFNSKSAEADASRTAMQQMAEGLRGDLGQVTASHAGLYRQLNDQSAALSNVAADLRSTKVTLDTVETRLTAIESTNNFLKSLLIVTSIAVIALLVLTAILLHRHA